ncbi:MAG: hypothetical protein LUC44_02445 [Prevotellaceae bacterium]|nr:hypothetical protein [Prevotellaceae bacterium]
MKQRKNPSAALEGRQRAIGRLMAFWRENGVYSDMGRRPSDEPQNTNGDGTGII